MGRRGEIEMAKKADEQQKPLTTYKGFDHKLACRGFQFEVGKTYKVAGKIQACSNGFHACENPFDVLSYYELLDSEGNFNRFAIVEQGGDISRHDKDTKIASAEINIKAELKLPEFIGRLVDFAIEATKLAGKSSKKGGGEELSDKGGHCAQIGSSGDSAKIGSSGHSAQIGSSGHCAQIGSSGDSAQIGSSGHSAQIGSSGHSAKIGSSGDSAKIGSSGHSAQIGSSGDSAQIGSSGDSAQIGSSGHYAKIGSSGHYGVIASAGVNTRAKGALGTWISLAEFDGNNRCIGFATGCIGQDGLEPDVFYRAQNGKLVKV
jgi:hypothetical protein